MASEQEMNTPDISQNASLKFILGLWFASIAFETGAQLAIKHAADTVGTYGNQFQWLSALVMDPWFATAVAFYLFGFFVWMAILRYHQLSVAIPVSSVSDVSVVVAGTIVFSEPVSGSLVCGILVIATGIWLLTSDDSKAGDSPQSSPKTCESANE